MTTASNAVQTNSIDTLTATGMTIGNANATNILLGSSTAGRTPTIVIDTLSILNSNASPAIAIGTSSSTKTVKINNATSSVHCSSVDLQGSAINNITGTTGALSVGNLQTDGILNIATNNARTATGVVNIATGTGAVCAVNILNGGASVGGSVNIANVGANTTAINIGSATGTGAINIQTANTGTAVNIANSNNGKTIQIGASGRTDNLINVGRLQSVSTNFQPIVAGDNMGIGNNQVSSTLDIGNAISRSGAITIANGTSGVSSTVTILGGIANSGVLNVGTGGSGVNTTSINLNTGVGTGTTTIGSSSNTVTMNGGTVNIQTGSSSSGTINIKTGATSSGTVNIATGTGVSQSTAVNIGSGTTTGAVTIGNSANTVQVNGTLAMGTGKNITLQPTASYTAPTAFTMLGGFSNNSFSSNIGSTPASGTYVMSSIQVPNNGIYLFTFMIQTTYTGAFNYFYSNVASTTTLQTAGTVIGTPNTVLLAVNFGQQPLGNVGSLFINTGGSFVYQLTATTYYNLILYVSVAGTLGIPNGFFQITRIG
jgi:hypothetical protein